MVDLTRVRRETMRWQIINVLNLGRPAPLRGEFIVSCMRPIWPDVTVIEVQRELDYLADRDLVKIDKLPYGEWIVDLTRIGIDLAEYTVECDPGIARPPIYWKD